MENGERAIECEVRGDGKGRLRREAEFGSTLDERIRDQFMLGCKMDKVCDELWLLDDPHLDEVILLAKRIEHSVKCVDVMKKQEYKEVSVVRNVSHKKAIGVSTQNSDSSGRKDTQNSDSRSRKDIAEELPCSSDVRRSNRSVKPPSYLKDYNLL
ncbi:hypothetical protein NDU88_003911 [Pleurodeles waltl]|uniref:Uncharacterized protein n=1 Tax=Pleurodeles waltl TaxID=8319 RepID=A0AAV7RE95_PLEWA|nr:hypothetical protein NDU88_003911 [Pleurodeles waltl]